MKLNLLQFKEALGNSLLNFKGNYTDIFDTKKITTDTRKIRKGDIFWPIKGDNFDGHDFIGEALKNGAKGFISETKLYEKFLSSDIMQEVFIFEVDDSLKAIQNLATFIRLQSSCKIIGITGSNGKTTTKDLISCVLSQSKRIINSPKSFNNHIGIPLTLMNLEEDTEYAIIEMGMNHKGELTNLMKIVKPDIGITLNASEAHMGNFDCFMSVVAAKGEMALMLNQNNLLIVNENLLEYFPFSSKLNCKIKTFGKNGFKDIDVIIKNAVQHEEKLTVALNVKGELEFFNYPGIGVVNSENIAAVVLCLHELGISSTEINEGFVKFTPPPMRMEMIRLPIGTLIINDAYNANPVSFNHAIEVLDSLSCIGKKYLVAGDMLELGTFSKDKHKNLGIKIKDTSINVVISYGEDSSIISNEVDGYEEKHGKHFTDKDALVEYLKSKITQDDIILLKGSRLNRLEYILQKLLENRESKNV